MRIEDKPGDRIRECESKWFKRRIVPYLHGCIDIRADEFKLDRHGEERAIRRRASLRNGNGRMKAILCIPGNVIDWVAIAINPLIEEPFEIPARRFFNRRAKIFRAGNSVP